MLVSTPTVGAMAPSTTYPRRRPDDPRPDRLPDLRHRLGPGPPRRLGLLRSVRPLERGAAPVAGLVGGGARPPASGREPRGARMTAERCQAVTKAGARCSATPLP